MCSYVCIFCFSHNAFAARNNDVRKVCSESVPQGAYAYAEKIAPDLLANVVGREELYDVEFESNFSIYFKKWTWKYALY